MDRVKTALDDLHITEEEKNEIRMDKRKKVDEGNDNDDDEEKHYKSKNLVAERKRRKKLSDRQLELRALVPIITNARMNKATIITDAITYIEELQKNVKDLSDQLLQMSATCVKDETMNTEEIDTKQEREKWGITLEVQVIQIDGNKLWTKIVFQKKRGAITKLIEAMNMLGFDLTDTSVTTSRGAVLVTSSIEGTHGGVADASQIKEFLLETINSHPDKSIIDTI